MHGRKVKKKLKTITTKKKKKKKKKKEKEKRRKKERKRSLVTRLYTIQAINSLGRTVEFFFYLAGNVVVIL